jgi:hypothetical protein
MKNLNQIRQSRKIEDFQIKNYMFYWVFDGKGDYKQMHREAEYRMFIERNYEAKSNQNF